MKKKRGMSLFTAIILEVLIIAFVIGLGYAIYYLITGDTIFFNSETKEIKTTQNSNVNNGNQDKNQISKSESKTEKKNDNINKNVKTVNLTLNGYSFEVPEDYTNTVDTQKIELTNKAQTYSSQIMIENISYNDVKTNPKLLNEYLGLNDDSDLPTVIKEFDGVEYLCIEMEVFGVKYLIAYTKLSNTQCITTTIMNETQTVDYDALKELTGIIKTAKKM